MRPLALRTERTGWPLVKTRSSESLARTQTLLLSLSRLLFALGPQTSRRCRWATILCCVLQASERRILLPSLGAGSSARENATRMAARKWQVATREPSALALAHLARIPSRILSQSRRQPARLVVVYDRERAELALRAQRANDGQRLRLVGRPSDEHIACAPLIPPLRQRRG